mgnify:CR=1 FL=1
MTDRRPTLFLHNGNTSILSRLNEVENIHLSDVPGSDIGAKADYLEQKGKSTNCCIADLKNNGPTDFLIDIDLTNISKNFYIKKIITSFSDDLRNLDPCWTVKKYNENQYLQALAYGLASSNEIIFLDKVNQQYRSEKGKTYIFSPGRCGSHLLLNQEFVPKTTKITHHYQTDQKTLRNIDLLTNAEEIFTVLRYSVFDQITSDFLHEEIFREAIVTTKENYNDIVKKVEQAKPQTIELEFCTKIFYRLLHFLDWYFLFSNVIQKKINLYFYEELSTLPKHNYTYIKNPYSKKELISNYDEIEDYSARFLQPLYDKLIQKITIQHKNLNNESF